MSSICAHQEQLMMLERRNCRNNPAARLLKFHCQLWDPRGASGGRTSRSSDLKVVGLIPGP